MIHALFIIVWTVVVPILGYLLPAHYGFELAGAFLSIFLYYATLASGERVKDWLAQTFAVFR